VTDRPGSGSPRDAFAARLAAQVEELRSEGLFREAKNVVSMPDGWCGIDGAKVRNLASNDYLNLAHDPRVIEAARSAVGETGVGSGASALVSGRGPWQTRLEEQLAEFEQTEAAIVFPTGYAANVGTLATLIESDDTVFCDRLNHASLVDGCRLSGAKFRVYRRDELDILERELKKASATQESTTSRRWIVTDSVFSMDGFVAPLPDLCDLAERYGALVILDEAHGTGVFGEHGRGVAEATRTEDRIAVRTGTLSKAVGCLGGFVAGSRTLIDVLRNSARTQMFSTALPGAVCAAACRSLELIVAEPERRTRLHELAGLLRSELAHFELPLIEGSVGPIVPLVLGEPSVAVRIAEELLREGFLVGAIRPPTVPRGTSRLRVSLTAAMQEKDIRALSVALARCVARQSM
jgi:8-amino-7-oxononanoate synthase